MILFLRQLQIIIHSGKGASLAMNEFGFIMCGIIKGKIPVLGPCCPNKDLLGLVCHFRIE